MQGWGEKAQVRARVKDEHGQGAWVADIFYSRTRL